MAQFQTHHYGTDPRRRSAVDEIVIYFQNLPQRPKSAPDFFTQWRRLASLPVGALTPKQICLIWDRTRQAWNAHGKKGFGHDFRTRLARDMHHWHRHAVPAIPDFNALQFDTSLGNHAQMGILPTAQFLDVWVRHASGRAQNLPVSELVHAGLSFSELGLPLPQDYAGAWLGAVQRRADEFGRGDRNLWQQQDHIGYLTMTLWTLAAQNALGHDMRHVHLARSLAAIAHDYPAEAWKDQAARAQMDHACQWFSIANTCPRPCPRGNTTSSLEREARDTFRRANLRMADDETRMSCMNKQTDFVLRTDNGRVYVEADGDSHFVIGPDGQLHYNGNTLLQTALANKNYPQRVFLRMPGASLQATRALEPATVNRMFSRIAALRERGGGAYMLAVAGTGGLRVQSLVNNT